MFDCLRCGVCCSQFDVLLTEADLDRFERQPRLIRLTWAYDRPGGLSAHFMKRDAATGRCVALRTVGREHRCTIYNDRPHLCRAFEVGSEDCLAARRAAGLSTTEGP